MGKLLSSLEAEHFAMVGFVVDTLLHSGARTATKFVSDKLVIRASMKLAGKKLPAANTRSFEIVLTIGAPNYDAREFIKVCKKAKEPFPIKKIQLQFPPKK